MAVRDQTHSPLSLVSARENIGHILLVLELCCRFQLTCCERMSSAYRFYLCVLVNQNPANYTTAEHLLPVGTPLYKKQNEGIPPERMFSQKRVCVYLFQILNCQHTG